MLWFQLLAGLYLIMISFVLDTENVKSTIVFKFVPFILGAAEVLLFLSNIGFISIND